MEKTPINEAVSADMDRFEEIYDDGLDVVLGQVYDSEV